MRTSPEESEKAKRALRLVGEAGIARPRDLEALGVSRSYLRCLRERGSLSRSGRGLYFLPDADVTESHTLAEACKRVPNGVVCLLSALRFHDLTTQNPREVWVAIGPKSHSPRLDYPPLRIARFSGSALTEGVEEHLVEGVSIRVYGSAKTVADCFKFRSKIGREVASEALRDGWRRRLFSLDEIWRYAEICRMVNVMRPYMEAICE
jgi:predicted transcriptional regulator of viral defense system